MCVYYCGDQRCVYGCFSEALCVCWSSHSLCVLVLPLFVCVGLPTPAAGMTEVCVSVTHRITHETFKGIMELSGLLEKKKKKKGKGKKGGKKVSVLVDMGNPTIFYYLHMHLFSALLHRRRNDPRDSHACNILPVFFFLSPIA